MPARPSIKSPCVADRYHAPRERIAEAAFPNVRDTSGAPLGALVRLVEHDDGTAEIAVYRCDARVRVRVLWEDGRTFDSAAADARATLEPLADDTSRRGAVIELD